MKKIDWNEVALWIIAFIYAIIKIAFWILVIIIGVILNLVRDS